ncbi:4-(cytidine 5'-diphospho)-2-C-methyl-D-erythritol kinase [Roseateles violae]|uniref:4-diphosphocytidyl-2-C-methyl-D-erythritol kinase n=1 Tax=Roseateles violae TaxID=3058042 RepID=A0ABT8DVQ3_9BURK|nr:4-(cytidine 5'-diphospho)-2-C-methyl-D-erythritol kinase [Pelomonas sp. PFR6]MDN3922385.1 4-(cytidine 5'-diphospho)-2-C-methyl-D-erythritol kinase [Pelomonas sp. PFR6]
MKAIYDVAAPAKLNLFLHVVGKRPDGYHLLQSIFALIDWADTLHFERRADGRLARHDSGQTSGVLPEDDLCLRAARALKEASGCELGADIHIEKRLPAGAGMGGGSSDAASTLLALNRLWGLNWPLSRLLPLGLKLGADVPFFLGGRNAFVEGIGEILHPVDLPAGRVYAVVKPAVSIATKQIFSSPLLARSDSVAIVAGFPAHNGSGANKARGDADWLKQGWGRNDLQAPAEAASSEVTQALQLLQNRFGNSRMTGSGSAVFAEVDGKDGMSSQSKATMLPELPAAWTGRICHGLTQHPLLGWAD